MATFHKYTMEFQGSIMRESTAGSGNGWSETFYDSSVIEDGPAVDRAKILCGARRGLLTPGWSLVAVRVSRLDPGFHLVRKGRNVFFDPQDQPGQYGAGLPGVDEQPYDAINISLSCLGGSRRAFLMRGIGQDLIGASGRFRNPAGWFVPFNIFLGVLAGRAGGPFAGPPYFNRVRTNKQYGTVVTVWTGGQAAPIGATPISPVIDCVEAFNPGILPNVSIAGIRGLTGINGTWVVATFAANPVAGVGTRLFLVRKRNISVSGNNFTQPGVCTTWQWTSDLITDATAGNGASRRTGRPTQLVRGRRSNRRF